MKRFLCWCMFALFLMEQASLMLGQEVKRASTHAGNPQATYRGGLVTPPLPKPHFVLTDTSGARFDFWNRTRGSITLLFFGYTYCPDECPMHMANLGAALKRLPPGVAGQVKLVFVTTDPHGIPGRNCAGGLTISINVLLASPEPLLLSMQPRRLPAFPWPRRRTRATASIQLPMPILLSRIPKTILATLSTQAGLVQTIGSMTCFSW